MPRHRVPSSTALLREEEQLARHLRAPNRAELAAAFAQALDLAEGRPFGHATRVCYIASHLARALRLPQEERRTVYYAALLHDLGVIPASAELCRLLQIRESAVFGVGPEKPPHQVALEVAPGNATVVLDLIRAHPERGAQLAAELGLPSAVQEAIAAHHERWDGKGYPRALKGDAIPVAARVVALADLLDSLINAGGNVLASRRSLPSVLAEHADRAFDPAWLEPVRQVTRQDEFWLGLHSERMEDVTALFPGNGRRTSVSPAEDLARFASVFSTLIDMKGEHTAGHSRRTAWVVGLLAEAFELDEERRAQLHIAALLHDIGLFGIPARILDKPDILTLSEMEVMRKHPSYSQQVLETLPGLEEVAFWVGAHHERPDGKGYPEMLEGDEIPFEARLLAVADTYVALTSTRPYRRALAHDDALAVLRGGAGTQFDPEVVATFCSLPPEALQPTSSRTAPRSRQTR